MNAERGRPRSFDPDAVLEQATQVFWRHGFQGTALSDLTAATGLNKPSLYAAFGDKESLYLKCLERYVAKQVAVQTTLLEDEPDGRKAIERFMRTMAAMQADPALPGGCFIVNGTADCDNPATPAAVDAALRNASGSVSPRLLKRLRRAEKDGHLPPGADPARMATLFGAVLSGMAVMSKAGRSRADLDAVVDAALMVWPQPKAGRPVRAR